MVDASRRWMRSGCWRAERLRRDSAETGPSAQGLSAGLSSPASAHLLSASAQGHGAGLAGLAGLEEPRYSFLNCLVRSSASLPRHAAELEHGEFSALEQCSQRRQLLQSAHVSLHQQTPETSRNNQQMTPVRHQRGFSCASSGVSGEDRA